MKKGLFFFIVLTALCLAVLLAGVSSAGKLCAKDKSFLCSVFTFAFVVNADSTSVVPDSGYAKYFIHPDLNYHQEFISSIFHPPRIIS